MLEMSGADAYFLWEESRARHMHTLKIIVVDPSMAHEPLSFARVREGTARALSMLLAFRRSAVRAPFGLGHPFWLDAPVLDVDYHIRHEVLPAGVDALDEFVGRVASEPLDETHPLWQLFFVEGLPAGHIAYVTKIHHAVADGIASAELLTRAFQTTPAPQSFPPPSPGPNEALPSAAHRIARALRGNLSRQRELPGLLWRSLRATWRSLRWRLAGRPSPVRPFSGPKTRFNRPITPNRNYAHITLPLSTLQQVRRAFGCSLNDVYLALVGGAVRRYLERRGELPAAALTAAVPVSVRSPSEDPTFGNATNYWFASTGSDEADPAERLRAVTASTRAAREQFAVQDPRLAIDWLDHWTLRRIYLDGFQKLAALLLRRPSYHLIVSSVRGPQQPLFSDGARVVAMRSMGPLTLQQGLNFTAWSYLDEFAIGVHACREHVPDLRSLTQDLRLELDALSAAAARVGPRERGDDPRGIAAPDPPSRGSLPQTGPDAAPGSEAAPPAYAPSKPDGSDPRARRE